MQREQIDHLMSHIEELTKKNDSQKEQLELEVGDTNKKLQEANEENVLLRTQIDQLKEEAQFLNQKIEWLVNEEMALRKQRDQAEGEVAEELRRELEELQEAKVQEEKTFNHRMEGLVKEEKALRNQILQLEGELEATKTFIEEERAKETKLHALQTDELLKERQQLKEEVLRLLQQIEDMKQLFLQEITLRDQNSKVTEEARETLSEALKKVVSEAEERGQEWEELRLRIREN